jgi:hypothetical protein
VEKIYQANGSPKQAGLAIPITDKLDFICRVFHPAKAQYTLFSADHRTFSKTDHILGYKQVLTNIRLLK